MDELGRYIVELHRPLGGWAGLRQAADRARKVAEEMRREGKAVRFLRSVFVPEDDTCFFIYEGPTRRSVKDAAVRAQLGVERLRRTISVDP